MNFSSIPSIQEKGFRGFVTVSDLQATKCKAVSPEPGVYFILRLERTPPHFMAASVGGHFKDKNPTVAKTELVTNWVDEALVLYIGKAGGSKNTATLKKRLQQYMRFGQGKKVGHWGGRYIWQLADYAQLQVCWLPTPTREPGDVETELIENFRQQYGKRPFANLNK